jgi:Ca2+-binding EF-hand superfamily protein
MRPFVARLSLLPLLALIAAPAAAQQAAPPAETLSKAKFLSGIDAEFAQMDTNKDKKVSAAELEQNRRATLVKRQQERVQAMFAELDADKNRTLSQQEFSRIAGQPPALNVQPFIARIDTNKDQSLSQAEYRAGAAADFDRLDTNKDGSLSPAELSAAEGATASASKPGPAAPEGR